MKRYDVILAVLTILVVGTLLVSFTASTNPFEKQKEVRDQQRTRHIELIKGNVETYYTRQNTLPKSIAEMRMPSRPVDPSTQKQYEYTKKSEEEYELCATYETEAKRSASRYTYGDNTYNNYKFHKKGRNCNTFNVNPYSSLQYYTPVPRPTQRPTQRPTPPTSSPIRTLNATAVPRPSLSAQSLTYENLGVTAVCKPYTRLYTGVGYVRETDPAFIGLMSREGRLSDRFELIVNSRDTIGTYNKKVITTSTTKYYDKDCNSMDFSKVREGYSVVVYAPTAQTNGIRQAAYVQLSTDLLPEHQ